MIMRCPPFNGGGVTGSPGLVLGVLSLLLSTSSIGIGASLEERFHTEAEVAWTKLEEFGQHLEGSFSVRKVYGFPSFKPFAFTRYDFGLSGNLAKVQIHTPESDDVRSINSGYFFTLNRKSEESPYKVCLLKSIDHSTPAQRKQIDEQVRKIRDYVHASWYMLGEPLSHYLHQPQFVISKISEDIRNGESLCRVDFEYRPGKDEAPEFVMKAGSYVVLDPNHFWCIREYLVYRLWGSSKGVLEYGAPLEGFPGVSKKTEVLNANDRRFANGMTTTMEVIRVNHSILSEKDFLLAAFGLPEPNLEAFNGGGLSTRRIVVLFMIILMFMCLVIGYRLQKRRNEV